MVNEKEEAQADLIRKELCSECGERPCPKCDRCGCYQRAETFENVKGV